MGLTGEKLAAKLRLAKDGDIGTYITKALELKPSNPRALNVISRRGMFRFLKFVSEANFSANTTTLLGDEIVARYDDYLLTSSISKADLWYARNACTEIVNLARSLAEADGHAVGPSGRRRPLRDARTELTAGTAKILCGLGEFGKFLGEALSEQTSDGAYTFLNHEVPYIRTFARFCQANTPQGTDLTTYDLSSTLVDRYRSHMAAGKTTQAYQRKSVSTADKIVTAAMALAHAAGRPIGLSRPLQLHSSVRKTADVPNGNLRKIESMEKHGGILKYIGGALRADLNRLETETMRTRIASIAYLVNYLKYKPIINFDNLLRCNMEEIFQGIASAEIGQATKQNRWKAVKAVLAVAKDLASASDNKSYVIPWPAERWLRQPPRRGNSDQGLSTVDASKVERLARQEIEEVLTRCVAQGPIFPGPYVEDLQAFELLLAFRTGFNPGTVRTLKLVDIREVGENIEVSGLKRRARKQPLAVFAKSNRPFTGPWLLEKILLVTSMARARAAPEFKDRLFLYERRRGPNRGHVRPFDPQKVAMESKSLAEFGRRAGVNGLTLRTMRASFSNLAFVVSGDDVRSVQRVMGHQSRDTTEEYSRSHTKRPREEILAAAMELRLRDLRTDLKRDARDRPLSTLSGATPGFACIDPFNPPAELRQLPGMCAAYGACPACPLASVDVTLPSSACDLLLLRDALTSRLDRQDTDPRRVSFWRLQKDALETIWLPRIAASVLREASRVRSFKLPMAEDFL